MKFTRAAACAACVLATASLALPARAQMQPTPDGVLGLSASASVEVQKDVLAITFSTTKDGADANMVQSQLKQALDAALAEARRSARPGEVDVQTGNFALYPRYAPPTSSGRASISGWQGSAELVVQGRDVAAISQLSARITTMTIARVEYRLSREASERVEGDVAAQAIAAFRAKAAVYAKQFGYGSVAIREVSVQTSEPMPGPQPMMRMQAQAVGVAAEPLPVEPGKALVSAHVNGTVQMK
ncbi:MAG TPA: SIMPL domain-containing protein [Vicinamibacterales bacterium]|jgi:predicted secreted protein|nr:SIMPL domain-containing protein [Vicinamibacterales bacterium]